MRRFLTALTFGLCVVGTSGFAAAQTPGFYRSDPGPAEVSLAGYRAGVAPAAVTEVNYPRRGVYRVPYGVYGRPYAVYRPYARPYSGYRPYYRYSPYGVRAYGFNQPYGYYYNVPRVYSGVRVY